MACDSLYAAWLKAHYPYQFYSTMLKLYTEKGNKEKVALILSEMKRYASIRLAAGRFGQDNRDWLCDTENKTISQALSSIKFISKQTAEDLYQAGLQHFDTFADLLRYLQTNACLDTRQIKILIGVNYFADFGRTGKLMNVWKEYFEGKNKVTKTLVEKTVDKRMTLLRAFEAEQPDEELPICERLQYENQNIGMCISMDGAEQANKYYVQDIDDQYGVKIKLYSVQRGTVGTMKMKKNDYAANPPKSDTCLILDGWQKKQRYNFQSEKPKPIPGEYDIWLQRFHTV